MSTFSVSNDEMDVGHLNLQFPRLSNQSVSSYADITTVTTPQLVPNDAVFVFCNAAAGTFNLVLPQPLVGRDLFVVTRQGAAVSSQNSSGVALSNIVDIENDPNASSPTTQSTILTSTGGAWVHLVGNGKHWVAVAKSLLLP